MAFDLVLKEGELTPWSTDLLNRAYTPDGYRFVDPTSAEAAKAIEVTIKPDGRVLVTDVVRNAGAPITQPKREI